MEYQSLKILHELISHDLNVLESSNLNQANPEKYQEFKKAYYDLHRKVVLYQNSSDASRITINANTTLGLKWDFAKTSSKFDFYMGFLGGSKEILNYQIEKIKGNIEGIIQDLNKDNYKEVKRKMNDALQLYQNILDKAVSTKEIQDLVSKVHYQIYKYQVEEFLVPSYDISLFIPLVYEDMSKILDSDASGIIKEELNKYFLDASLVKKYFNQIVMLINMAKSNPNVSRQELEEKLNIRLYQEDDIKLEYKGIDHGLKTYADSNFFKDLESFYYAIYLQCKEKEINLKEAAPVVLYYFVRCNYHNYELLVHLLEEYHYTDIQYLCEAIIWEYAYAAMSIFTHLKNEFARIGKNYDYEMDCAIIAQKEKIEPKSLVEYALKNHVEYLINYILTSDNLELLVSFYLETKSQMAKEKIEYLLRHDKITTEVLNDLPVEDFKDAIINAFKDRNNEEIEELLLFSYSEEKINWLVEEMLKSHDFEDFFQYIYQKIDEGIMGAKFISIKKNFGFESLYYNRLFHFSQSEIDSMSPLGAYCVSMDFSLDDCSYDIFLYFLKKFYLYKLDWQNIMKVCKLRKFDTRDVYKYFCLGNREEFMQYYKEHDINLDSHFFLEIIKSDESVVSDWLEFLSVDDILSLPKSTLNIFVKYYEEKLKDEHIILKDKIAQVFSKEVDSYDENPELIYLFVYIVYNGLFDEDILFYIDNFIFIPDFEKLLYKSIENSRDSYLKVHYVLKIAEKYYSILSTCYDLTIQEKYDSIFTHLQDFIFMDDESILELKNNNDEFSNLKLRKYYGDLLRLLNKEDKIEEKLKIRIILEVVKSGIHEYIFYLKEHYPEYLELILSNIDDASLYQSLVDYNGSMSIDDALRVEMLKRKL